MFKQNLGIDEYLVSFNKIIITRRVNLFLAPKGRVQGSSQQDSQYSTTIPKRKIKATNIQDNN